jgi:ammonium transporter, Amt family
MKMIKSKQLGLWLMLPLILFGTNIFAQLASTTAKIVANVPEPKIDTGDTAWMIAATALVLLMTIPALALFYGGLVNRKNVLNTLMQCFIISCIISLEWIAFGYSNAFGSSHGFLAPFIGGFDWSFMHGIKPGDLSPYYISHSQAVPGGGTIGTIPHFMFILFQCKFAVITPALIIGASAERIKFRGFLIFTFLWAIFVYNPIAHWVWASDGWLAKMGTLDFAGGTVVHINSGIAALVVCLMLGRRKIVKQGLIGEPHNIPQVVIGAGLLWFGWFGFNAGSGLAADGLAASAFLVTHIASAMAAFTWALIDWRMHGKPSVVGICTGAVAGLVAITPASGFVDTTGAFIIGILVGVVCWIMVNVIKKKFGYDDALDAFGVHGIGGIVGALATGLFATAAVQATCRGAFYGNPAQLWIQTKAVMATIIWSGAVTALIFWIVNKTVGIRATEAEEESGMDEAEFGEDAYRIAK